MLFAIVYEGICLKVGQLLEFWSELVCCQGKELLKVF